MLIALFSHNSFDLLITEKTNRRFAKKETLKGGHTKEFIHDEKILIYVIFEFKIPIITLG